MNTSAFDCWYAIQEEKIREDKRKQMLEDEEITRLRQENDRQRMECAELKTCCDLVVLACEINEQSANALLKENAALKLELQKLKGLIEEAKKHVGMANLMLA